MDAFPDVTSPAPGDDQEIVRTEDQMLREELAELATNRPAARLLKDHLANGAEAEGPYTFGLALSGGGIRSATVSLGILQKLAGAGLLKHVDYLSTVSGGGYIGSALTWWLRGNAPGEAKYESFYDVEGHFPFGTQDPSVPEPASDRSSPEAPALTPLQFLRDQGNYLAPGNGISLWSGAAVVLRAILLNLMIWIPVTTFVMGLLYALGFIPGLKGLPFAVRMLAPGTLETAADIVGSSGELEVNRTIPPVFLLMLVAAVALAVLFVIGSINHSLLSWTSLTESEMRAERAEKPAAEKQKWFSWLLAGLAGVVDIALLGITILWLLPAVKLLFTDGHYWLQATTPLPVLSSGITTGVLLWLAVFIASGLCFWLMGEDGIRRSLSGKNQKAVLFVLIGLFVIMAAGYLVDYLFNGPGVTLVDRIAAFLLFTYGVAYLAFVNYLVGLLIRHLLRAEAVGNPLADMRTPTTALLQYRARRVFEWFYGKALFAVIVLILVGSLPLVSHYIDYGLGGVWTALGLAVTLGGQFWSRIRGNSRLTELTIIIGSALFAYGILLVGHRLAVTFMDADATLRALIAAAIIAALIAGWFVNTNQIGLHRFYRDRLMEAFLPDDAALSRDTNAAATGANERRLADCWSSVWSKGPYQIINTNMVLTNSSERKYRLRGGDNFMLTPHFVGSSATRWYRGKDTACADMTLSSAMAISGAAANPRGAAGGHGLTRSPSVALAMSLLNIRLGYWIPNPARGQPGMLLRRPNHFWPGGLYALTRGGYVETAKWVELADGGHFENLAVYELVRRRCGLIIVCDGGQDNASSYADMVTAVQRIGQDFGATVHFDMAVKNGEGFDKSGPAQMIAKATLTDYPKGAEFAEKGYFVGRIDYGARGGKGWPRSGILIYLKSALIRELAVGAKGYRGAHHDFPNESTGDQFFDEEQFEAYREVGYRICEQMVSELDLGRLFRAGPPALARLRRNARFRPVRGRSSGD